MFHARCGLDNPTCKPKGKLLEQKFAQQAAEDYAELSPLAVADDSDLNLKYGTDMLFQIGQRMLAVGLTMKDDLCKIIKDVEKASKAHDWYVEVVIQGNNWSNAIDNALEAINNEIRDLMKAESVGFYVVYANGNEATIDCFNSRSPKTRGY